MCVFFFNGNAGVFLSATAHDGSNSFRQCLLLHVSLTKGYGGRSSLDVSLSGLVNSVRDEESNSNISAGTIISPAKVGYDKANKSRI